MPGGKMGEHRAANPPCPAQCIVWALGGRGAFLGHGVHLQEAMLLPDCFPNGFLWM